MARAILILGDMGTGKSTSLRNLPPDETIIVRPNTKDLPWEGAMNDYSETKGNLVATLKIQRRRPDDVTEHPGVLDVFVAADANPKIKYVVLEDITHFMNDRMMEDSFMKSEDWGKWNKFGSDMFSITTKNIAAFREDLTFIIIGHTEIKDNGTIGLQTAGKLLDNTIKLPSYFTYVLHTRVFTEKGALVYRFQTHNDGKYLAKTPMNLFKEDFVDNDIYAVVQRIEEFRHSKKPAISLTK